MFCEIYIQNYHKNKVKESLSELRKRLLQHNLQYWIDCVSSDDCDAHVVIVGYFEKRVNEELLVWWRQVWRQSSAINLDDKKCSAEPGACRYADGQTFTEIIMLSCWLEYCQNKYFFLAIVFYFFVATRKYWPWDIRFPKTWSTILSFRLLTDNCCAVAALRSIVIVCRLFFNTSWRYNIVAKAEIATRAQT